jgi:hypothetical protein
VSERNELGRPPVLDDKKKADICAVVLAGGSRAIAAAYVGCHPDTIRNTEARDAEFASALEAAESKHEVLQLSYINNAGKEGRYWRAAAWVLEHRYPTRYGLHRTNLYSLEQMTHVLTQFAELLLDEISDEDLRRRLLARIGELTAGLQTAATGAEP